MKIVNGIMAQLPYTPPRTQLCIVELEDGIATSGDPTTIPIAINESTNITASPFTSAPEEDMTFVSDITITYPEN